MAVVKFNVVDEFIAELEKEIGPGFCNIERGIVRVSYLNRETAVSPNIRHLLVVATAKLFTGDIMRLQSYCGQIWNMEDQDKPVLQNAEEKLNKIREACQKLGLEVRAGAFEESG